MTANRKHKQQKTLLGLSSRLVEQGLMTEADTRRMIDFGAASAKGEQPLLVTLLLCAGAWLSALLAVGLVVAYYSIFGHSYEYGYLVWGVSFIAAAVVISYFGGIAATGEAKSFLWQFSLALILAGKGLVLVHVNSRMYSGVTIYALTATALGLTIATYFVYKSDIERFVMALTTLLLLFISALNFHAAFGNLSLFSSCVVPLYYLGLLAGTWYMFQFAGRPRVLSAVSYAFAIALPVTLLYRQIAIIVSPGGAAHIIWPENLLLCISTVNIGLSIIGRRKSYHTMLATALAAVIISIYSHPGILAAIMMLALGYQQRDRLIYTAGVLSLPIYLFMFYYQMDISLMSKSIILMLNGVFFLTVGIIIKKKWLSI